MRRLHFGRVRLEARGQAGTVDVPVEVGRAGGLVVVVEAPRSWRVDLGLFDPGGFRGWSGSARRVVFVGPDWATPGYLPGEVTPGVWRVRLGPHALPEDGGEVELSVLAASHPPEGLRIPEDGGGVSGGADARAGVPRPDLPGDGERRWLRGDLHAHTVHSDGVLSVTELAAWAAGRGLDFLAVSDHNTISHHAELPDAARRAGIEVLAAQEVTTDLGHAVVVGVADWVDPGLGLSAWLDAVEAASGVVDVAHPQDATLGWRLGSPGPSALIEVWNGGGDNVVQDGLAAMVEQVWHLGGRGFVGGSDFHAPGGARAPGSPTTWVLAAPGDVLGGLRSGPVSVSAGPEGPVVVPVGEGRVLVVGGEGLDLVSLSGRRRAVAEPSVELEIEAEPVWLEGAGRVWAAWAPPCPEGCAVPSQGRELSEG
jgi:hypothetical protein